MKWVIDHNTSATVYSVELSVKILQQFDGFTFGRPSLIPECANVHMALKRCLEYDLGVSMFLYLNECRAT